MEAFVASWSPPPCLGHSWKSCAVSSWWREAARLMWPVMHSSCICKARPASAALGAPGGAGQGSVPVLRPRATTGGQVHPLSGLKGPQTGRGHAVAPRCPPALPHHAHSRSPRSSQSRVGCPPWALPLCSPLAPGHSPCPLLPPRCQLPEAREEEEFGGVAQALVARGLQKSQGSLVGRDPGKPTGGCLSLWGPTTTLPLPRVLSRPALLSRSANVLSTELVARKPALASWPHHYPTLRPGVCASPLLAPSLSL